MNLTKEQIQQAARNASQDVFTSTNAAADFETGWVEGAEWAISQMQDQWVAVSERLRETELVLNELKRSMQRLSNTNRFLDVDQKRLEKAIYIQKKYFDVSDCLRIERSQPPRKEVENG